MLIFSTFNLILKNPLRGNLYAVKRVLALCFND